MPLTYQLLICFLFAILSNCFGNELQKETHVTQKSIVDNGVSASEDHQRWLENSENDNQIVQTSVGNADEANQHVNNIERDKQNVNNFENDNVKIVENDNQNVNNIENDNQNVNNMENDNQNAKNKENDNQDVNNKDNDNQDVNNMENDNQNVNNIKNDNQNVNNIEKDNQRVKRYAQRSDGATEKDDRFERATISRHPFENQILKQRNRNRDFKRRKVRVSEIEEILKGAVGEVVHAALQKELQPLHTALRIVKLDSHSENMVRQLNTLEHIQSKLLTEYGEMRQSVSAASRNVQELAQQVAGLDTKIEILTKEMGSSARHCPIPSVGDSSHKGGSLVHQMEETKSALKVALSSFSAKVAASQKEVKDNLSGLESRLSETIKRSQEATDYKLVLITSATTKLLNNTSSKDTSNYRNSRLFSFDSEVKTPKYFLGAPQQLAPDVSWMQREQTDITDVEEDSLPKRNEDTNSDDVTAAQFGRQVITEMPRDCADIAEKGEKVDGVFTLYPTLCSPRLQVKAWCDMTTLGGGWTVIQRRGSKDSAGRDDFFKEWAEYKWGFGERTGDYWLGNEYIHHLTSTGDYELRVELRDWVEETKHATYSHFYLSGEGGNYTLSIGDYRGNAGNSLRYHHGAPFSTKDRDNDANPMSHCARTFHGAWWFTSCHESHLNGRYHRSPQRSYGDGINWMTFRGLSYSHKYSEMMIRPVNHGRD